MIPSSSAILTTTDDNLSIGGNIIGFEPSSVTPIRCWCFKLSYNTFTNLPVQLSVYNIFDPTTLPFREVVVLPKDPTYTFDNLPAGNYSVFAFEDSNQNGKVSLNAPLGWWGSSITPGRLAPITLNAKNGINAFEANITLKQSHPYPNQFIKGKNGGSLRQVNGYNVLHLKGSAVERGYDHGYLAAQQIVDWFRFYVLEQLISPNEYASRGIQFLQTVLQMDDQFKAEGNAVLAGMKDSGVDTAVPELSREFNLLDLFAINAYIEIGDFTACTQFVVWGHQTTDGNLIAARNMDGENDLRKVTVSHLTIFAVEPTEPDQYRFVSIMWPGFLGTLTSVNEKGLYAMMNTGRCATGPQVSHAQPVAWSLRHVIASLSSEDATPAQTEMVLSKFKSSGGGISTSGTVFMFARQLPVQNGPPAYVYEGDKYGGQMRTPAMVSPFIPSSIMASNHFLVYGVNPYDPTHNFGQSISFSSNYRYYTGEEALLSWNRTNHLLITDDLVNILQRVAGGATEHSVIWTPHDRKLLIANANMDPTVWDAPYLKWTQFYFDDLFKV